MSGHRRLALAGFVGICLLHETHGFYGPRVAKPRNKGPLPTPSAAQSHAPPSSTPTTLSASTAALAEPPQRQNRQQAPMTSDDAVVVVLRSCQPSSSSSSSRDRGGENGYHHTTSDAPQRMDPGGLTPLNLATVVHQTVTQLRGDGPPMNPLQRQELEVRLQRLLCRVEVALPEFNHDPLVTVINGLAKLPPRTLRDVLPLDVNPNHHTINSQPEAPLRPSAMLLPALLKRATKVALQSTPRSLAVLINSLARLESHLEPRRLVLPQGLLPNIALRARDHFPPPPQTGDESDSEDSAFKPETTTTTTTPTATTNQRFTCQGMSNLINGFARLRFHPGKKFMAGFCAETLLILDEMEPQTLSNVINGLSKLGHRPDTDFLERFTARARVVLHEFTPQGLSNIVNGFARLSPPYYPGGDFLDTLRDLSASCLSNFESRGLAALAHGFSTLGYHPGGAYLDALALAMARRLEAAAEAPPGSSMHTRDVITGWSLSTVYNGLARLDWKPDGGLVADANADLSYVPLASETRGDKRPGARLWAATLRWLHTQAPSLRDRPSHDVAMGHVIPPASVTMVAANQLLEPQQLTQLLWSLAVMGPPPAAMGLFSRLLATAVQHLDKASACPHAQRQLRQVALFVEAVLGWDGAMAAVGGAAMRVSEDHLQRPPSSLFHKEVLRVVEQALGAVCVRNEVDDGVYVKDMVLYPRPTHSTFSSSSSSAAAASPGTTSTSTGAATTTQSPLPVVIEVDGPPHFYINHPRRCGGDHRLKSRLLSAQTGRTNGGVISIAWWEWVGQPRVERVRLILRKLMRVGVDPRAYLAHVDEWAPVVGVSGTGPVAPAMAPPTVSAALMSASEWAMGIGDAPHSVRGGKAYSAPPSASSTTTATAPSSSPLTVASAAAGVSETSAPSASTAPPSPSPSTPTHRVHLDTAPFAFSVVREEGHILSPRQSSSQRPQKTPSISLHTHHGWASATFTVSSDAPACSSSTSSSVSAAPASSSSPPSFARVQQQQQQPLEHMTVTELRDLLRAVGMPVSGRKSELIQRLEAVGPKTGRGGKWRRAGSSSRAA